MSFEPVPPWPGLANLFSGDAYRFRFQLRSARPGWLSAGRPDPRVLAERRRLLDRTGAFQWSPAASDAWKRVESLPGFDLPISSHTDATQRARSAAGAWAPDFILLSPVEAQRVMSGGAVCFPSGWAPEEKLGRTVGEIHAPVPTLNRDLGSRIDRFLSGLARGDAMERDNWGLAAVPDLDLHPQRPVPRIDARTPIERLWFRLEEQSFHGLGDGHVLFLIHVRTWPLSEVLTATGASTAFQQMLQSMPPDIARYKGLGTLPDLTPLQGPPH